MALGLLGGIGSRAASPEADVDADRVQQYAQDIAQARHQAVDPALLGEARTLLQRRDAMERRARQLGLDRVPAVRARAELAQQGVLVQALVDDYLHQHPVTEAQIRGQYQQFTNAWGHFEYELRQVVAPTQSQAAAVIDRLKAGQSFDSMVQQAAGWGDGWQGMSLGWLRQGQLAPPFDQVVATLKPGQYTQVPVYNQFGWHVIELHGVRPASAPPLDQVRDAVRQQIQVDLVKQLEASVLAPAQGASAAAKR